MKKLLLFICFFGFLFFQGKAQADWLCVYPDKKVYFEDSNKLVYTIRIDSTTDNNTILYPFSDLHQTDWNCYSITSGSWLSRYIVLDENGNTFFVNDKEQRIFIKNQGDLSEVWEAFENENIKVKGEITSISLKSVLEKEDSVKTISFSVYDTHDMPINHDLNGLSIEVSKHFGLVKTVDFYSFGHWVREFNLIGINEPQLGFQPINLREQYFDFQVGDELHIYDLTDVFLSSLNENKIIIRYLSRNDYQDSIVYSYERKVENTTKRLVNGSVVTNTSTSTEILKQKIVKELLFNTEPNEIWTVEEYGMTSINKAMIINTERVGLYFTNQELTWNSSTSCLEDNIAVDICFYGFSGTYYLGLGGPYQGCCDLWMNRYCYDLVYYKKGDVTFGTPFDFDTSVSEVKNDVSSFSIYPNPAKDFITINSANNGTLNNAAIEIYDVSGRKQLGKNLDNAETIDVSSLVSGYYVVKLMQEDKDVAFIRMIKK